MSLNSNALIDDEELKLYLKLTDEDGLERREQLINSVSQFIENYCERKFMTQTDTVEVWSGGGLKDYWVTNAPITSTIAITSLEYRSGTTWTALTSSYTIAQNLTKGRIWFIDGNVFWSDGGDDWRVTYSSGYASIGAVPDDLKLAALIMISTEKKLAEGGLHGTNSKSFGDTNMSYNFEVTKKVKSILDSYKRY